MINDLALFYNEIYFHILLLLYHTWRTWLCNNYVIDKINEKIDHRKIPQEARSVSYVSLNPTICMSPFIIRDDFIFTVKIKKKKKEIIT